VQEYLCEAIVLNFEPNGDLDGRFSLFTRKFGKITAKAKSSRKITSKLSGHLQPGSFSAVRLIEKNGLQVVDALKKERVSADLDDLYRLNLALATEVAEPEIWDMLKDNSFNWRKVLRFLGWDPQGSVCGICRRGAAAFSLRSHEFLCSSCASRLSGSELIYLH